MVKAGEAFVARLTLGIDQAQTGFSFDQTYAAQRRGAGVAGGQHGLALRRWGAEQQLVIVATSEYGEALII